MNNKIEIYCVTNKKLPFLENFDYNLATVGTDSFSDKYIKLFEQVTGENFIKPEASINIRNRIKHCLEEAFSEYF